MDPAYQIVKHLVNTTYDDIPPTAVAVAKLEILDTIGVSLAGSPRPVVQKLIEVLKEFGGNGQSSVIASGIKLPVPDAGQINTMMSYTLDWDDTTDFAVIHPGCVVVPAAFAVSEYRGKVSGKEFITAVILGTDLMTRLSLAAKLKTGLILGGWNYSTLYGYMTTAAVAGKILGFSENEFIHAIGLGYQQASGTLQFNRDGAENKSPDFSTRGGLLAAFMAQKGITGPKNWIEGEFGMYNLYHRGGYDREALMGDLGKYYKIEDLSIKPYPSCRITHAFIDATLALVKEHNIKPEQVVEITAAGNDGGYSLCVPIEVKRQPINPTDSQFNVPWAIAASVVRGKASISEFSAEAIKDKSILEMVKKVKAKEDPDLMAEFLPAKVTITTKEGTYIKHVVHPSGSPQNPWSYDDCSNKFRDCASYSIKPLSKESVESIINRIEKLEDLPDVAEIMAEIN